MGKQKHFYLIRGLVREADHWGPFPEFLREHNPHCKITTLDLPGAGELLNEKVPLSVEGMVDKMHQYYQAAQSDEIENHVIAVSLGAMIAVSWMKKKPQDFHKAISSIQALKTFRLFITACALSPFFISPEHFLLLEEKRRAYTEVSDQFANQKRITGSMGANCKAATSDFGKHRKAAFSCQSV